MPQQTDRVDTGNRFTHSQAAGGGPLGHPWFRVAMTLLATSRSSVFDFCDSRVSMAKARMSSTPWSPTLAVDGDTGDELAEQLSRRLTDIVDLAVARGHGLSATTESLTVVSPDTFDPGLITAAHRGADTPLYTLRYNRDTKGIEYWSGHRWEPNPLRPYGVTSTRNGVVVGRGLAHAISWVTECGSVLGLSDKV